VETSEGFHQAGEWGNLTDDDGDYIAGSRDKFAGKLQQRYGLGREQAQKRADEWLKAQQDAKTQNAPR